MLQPVGNAKTFQIAPDNFGMGLIVFHKQDYNRFSLHRVFSFSLIEKS
jgi:hypothetical protein